MTDPKKTFHRISYLQYPFMLVGLFYCCKPLISNFTLFWSDFNIGLIFMGLGISFSTLQDTTKTQHKFSKKTFENPKYARMLLMVLGSEIIIFMVLGLIGLFSDVRKPLHDLSFGFISLAIGIVGLLKAAIEMAENHRKKETV